MNSEIKLDEKTNQPKITTKTMTSIDLTDANSKEISGSVVSFHNINYEVDVRKRPCSKPAKKVILSDITGIFKPGLNAILGPTGGGKSSLLDVLAGRKEKKGLTGNILIDGHTQPSNFKCMSGYVVQDDIVMGTLTVKENLMFSANLRLPSSITNSEKVARVENIMHELGISHVANTKVGNQFIRGISGGERKRTTIGMELIISPSVLFLDEPTTGLDASTANAVLRLLHRLSRRGRTIIFSIHQPRFSIFKLFDRLMLLCRGLSVYHGPATLAVEYFKSIGYECEELNNPPDFFLDVINGDSTAIVDDKEVKDSNTSLQKTTPQSGSENAYAKQFHEKYTQSTYSKDVFKETDAILNTYKLRSSNNQEVSFPEVNYETNFFQQFFYLNQRSLKNVFRNPAAAIMQTVVLMFFALIVGIIYYKVPDDSETGLQNRIGAFFFMSMNQAFINLSALEIFIRERAIFSHENVSGYYRCFSYFASKVVCDLIPLRAIPLIIFSLIAYFMLGLGNTAGQFFFFLLCLYCTTMTASAICFFYSSTFETLAIANIASAMTFVVMMLFNGFLVNLDSIGDWLSWLKYFSFLRYCLNGLLINELKGLELSIVNPNNQTIWIKSGERYLQTQKIDYEELWDKWSNIVAMLIMTFCLFTLTYVQLRRLKKLK